MKVINKLHLESHFFNSLHNSQNFDPGPSLWDLSQFFVRTNPPETQLWGQGFWHNRNQPSDYMIGSKLSFRQKSFESTSIIGLLRDQLKPQHFQVSLLIGSLRFLWLSIAKCWSKSRQMVPVIIQRLQCNDLQANSLPSQSKARLSNSPPEGDSICHVHIHA